MSGWVWELDNLLSRVTYVDNDIVLRINEEMNIGRLYPHSAAPIKQLYCRIARLTRPIIPADISAVRRVISSLGLSNNNKLSIQIIPWGKKIGIVAGEDVFKLSRKVQDVLRTPFYIEPHIHFYQK